jgi:subtilisin family serine protease
MRFLLIAALLFGGFFNASGQYKKYWVYLSDKCSESIINYEEIDSPLCHIYIDSLINYGVIPLIESKWLNAFSTCINDDQKGIVESLGFVSTIEEVKELVSLHSYTENEKGEKSFSYALDQIGIQDMERYNLSGKGVKVGVIDAGYIHAKSNEYLRHLFEDNKIVAKKDFLTKRDELLFSPELPFNDSHGTEVLQMIVGKKESENVQIGFAPDASIYLARTEHPTKEFRQEEDFWIAALEWMVGEGVKLINSSLGYSTGFDKAEENYTPDQMDGKTAAISRAAQIAAEKKGVLIVVAAGNEGTDRKWRIICAPADAQGVLSVGATGYKQLQKMPYSSEGPSSLPYLKPNVSCFASMGTSFAAPIITGLAACVMQKNPKLSNSEVISLIERSSHLYPYGNNYIGYGVPSAERLFQLMEGSEVNKRIVEEIYVSNRRYSISPLDFKSDILIVFHKGNEYNVLKQVQLKVAGKQKIVIKREAGVKRTTLATKEKLLEIIWDK